MTIPSDTPPDDPAGVVHATRTWVEERLVSAVPPSAKFHTGTTLPPPNIVGAEGDYYIHVISEDAGVSFVGADIYGPKTATYWPSTAPLDLRTRPSTDHSSALSLDATQLPTTGQWTGTIAMASAWRLTYLYSSTHVRLRLYLSAATRDADTARPSTTAPSPMDGCYLDVELDASTNHFLVPLAHGVISDPVLISDAPITIDALDPATAGADITMSWQVL